MRTKLKIVVHPSELVQTHFYTRLWPCLLVVALGCMALLPVVSEKTATVPEEIEWIWEVRPPYPDPALPNVLLLGDSQLAKLFSRS